MKTLNRRSPRVVRSRQPGGAPAPRGVRGKESLEIFLRDIRDTPVLTAAQEQELSLAMQNARQELLHSLSRVPGVGQRLVVHWRKREEQDLVPELLSERHEPGRKPAEPLALRIAEIGKRVATVHAATTDAARERAIDRLARSIEAFEPLTSLLVSWVDDLLVDLEGKGSPKPRWGLRREELARRAHEADVHRKAYLDARSTFVQHNLRLVVHMAKDFKSLGLPMADLIQEGNVSLIRAVEKFDGSRGFRFSTYAAWWIQQAFHRCFQRDGRVVRLPSQVLDRHRHLRREEGRLYGQLGREPTLAELSSALGIDEEDVERAQRTREPESSLEAPVGSENANVVADLLADPEVPDPLDGLAREQDASSVAKLLRRLDSRERAVLRGRFGLGSGEEKTLQVMAQELGLSRERVRQIEKKALESLRERIGREGIECPG